MTWAVTSLLGKMGRRRLPSQGAAVSISDLTVRQVLLKPPSAFQDTVTISGMLRKEPDGGRQTWSESLLGG